MKRLTNVLLSLTFAISAGVALAQPAPLPDDERFDQRVEFATGNDGEDLTAMVSALARSVDLTPIVDGVPETTIRYDIGDPKPFRQVWDLVLTLNDLVYVLQDNDVVVVGTPESLAPLLDRAAAADAPEPATDADAADEADEAAERPETVQRFYRVNSDPEELADLLRRAGPEGIDIEALPGVRSIVVVGTEEQQETILGLLDEFDTSAEEVELVQRVYSLSNAEASDLAEVLQSSDVVVAGQASGDEEDGEPSFSVVADERTNSLIITATRSVQDSIAELIPELDVPQEQVNVQVRIQEVNRRVVDSFGINVDAASGNFAASLLSTGLNFVFDAQQAVSGLNISAVLDALESQGLSRRVDDSTLTVLNNGTGRMQAGGRIEIQFPSGEGELATRTIEFGVIIEVEPRIASDGRVILDVTAEVSDVLVPLSEGGIPERIDFSTREVSSTVTLRPGQTVLLAGLLQNSFQQTERRIPILGSIPVIGALFGQTEIEDENTELLLVVNADVID